MREDNNLRLTDLDLFGNDAAEDEQEDVFRSYLVARPEETAFSDADRPLAIARAYKGEGKSALLRITQLDLQRTLPDGAVLVTKPAADLSPDIDTQEFAAWTRAWKASIFGALANEIGSRIGTAWTDDAMTLVEEAERNGFRARGLVGAIIDRLSGTAEVASVKLSVPERKRPELSSLQGAVRRRAKNVPAIWLLIDDVDKNFENTPRQRTRVASFFDAARELVRAVPELHLRTAIRPNVWTTIKMEFESLSHVEQYVVDLHWSEEDCRELIARRVEGYLERKSLLTGMTGIPVRKGAERDKTLIALAFESPMPWGGTLRPPHVIIFTLSKQRPRWIVELCKVAATKAARASHARITRYDLTTDLGEFGAKRIQDTVAEFRSQCGQIEELIDAFHGEREQLTTDQLLRVIEKKILTHLEPRISGIVGQPKALQIAAFLYEIGFFFGRRDYPDGTYQHVTFSSNPSLLRSRTNLDAGLTWEIHPVFRQSLEMRDATGREVRPERTAPHQSGTAAKHNKS